MQIRLVLADDHSLVRQGIRAFLEKEGLSVVGEASDGREAIRLVQERHPSVAILDLEMPLLNGLDAAKTIIQTCPETKVALLTLHREEAYVLEAFRAGVSGYILKSMAADDLVQAIRTICAGNIYVSPSISRTVVDALRSKRDVPADPLSPREREVLQLIAEGKTSKEIANLLGVTPKTAESHRSRIMQKLSIHDVAGLVRYAIRCGLIQP